MCTLLFRGGICLLVGFLVSQFTAAFKQVNYPVLKVSDSIMLYSLLVLRTFVSYFKQNITVWLEIISNRLHLNRYTYLFILWHQQHSHFLQHCVQNTKQWKKPRNPGILKENHYVNLYLISGSLVERSTEPQGIQLANPFAVAKCESIDLVELAREIQKVSIWRFRSSRTGVHRSYKM
jgi:hypothetical protein